MPKLRDCQFRTMLRNPPRELAAFLDTLSGSDSEVEIYGAEGVLLNEDVGLVRNLDEPRAYFCLRHADGWKVSHTVASYDDGYRRLRDSMTILKPKVTAQRGGRQLNENMTPEQRRELERHLEQHGTRVIHDSHRQVRPETASIKAWKVPL